MAADTYVKPIVRIGTTTDGLTFPLQRALVLSSDSGFTVTSVEDEVIQGPDGATITGYYLVALANPTFEDVTITDVTAPRTVIRAIVDGQSIDILTIDNAGPTAILGNDSNISEININVPAGGSIGLSSGGTACFLGLGADFIQIGIASTARIKVDTNGIGFFAATPVAKQAITGSRADPEQALKNLLTKLALYGLITDSTTA